MAYVEISILSVHIAFYSFLYLSKAFSMALSMTVGMSTEAETKPSGSARYETTVDDKLEWEALVQMIYLKVHKDT